MCHTKTNISEMSLLIFKEYYIYYKLFRYLESGSLASNFRLIVIGRIKAQFFKAQWHILIKVSLGAQHDFLLKTPRNVKIQGNMAAICTR